MKKWFGLLAAVLAAAIIFAIPSNAKAEGGTDCTAGVTLDTLANQGLLKLNGRVQIKSGYLRAEYSGTGFETNVTVEKDAEIRLTFQASYANKLSAFVDGKLVKTQLFPACDGEFLIPVTAGQHTLKIVKENQLPTGPEYFRLHELIFSGTVDSRPADKDFLVEVIGDSYSCGDGADAKYQPGYAWTCPRDDAITKSFGWYLAEMMGADFREVGRGGQGLDGTASQESQTNKVTMPVLYDYANYEDQTAGVTYTDTRKANLVIIELGANDSGTAANAPVWAGIAKDFILKVKATQGANVPVVWSFSTNKSYFYVALRNLVENDPELSAYDDIYIMLNYLNRNGSAAKATQLGGHPDAIDQYQYAERLKNFIDVEGVIKKAAPVYSHDLVYYVSENGNDSNDGLTAATAKKTVGSVNSAVLAATSGKTYENDARVVIKISGTVTLTASQNMMTNVGIKAGVKHKDGTTATFVLETLDYDGTNRATLKSTYKPSNTGSAASFAYAPVTFKNVHLNFAGLSTDGKYAVDKLYIQDGDLTLDNVTVENALGTKVSVYANGFSYDATLHGGFINGTSEKTNTLTLLNGVYDGTTGFGTVAAMGGSASYWSSAKSYTEAPGLTCKVVIGEGATVSGPNLKFITNGVHPKEVILEVQAGGKVDGKFMGTPEGTSDAHNKFVTNVTLNLCGGKFRGPFYMLGGYTDLTGNTTLNMTGGEIVVPAATTEADNSCVLGGGRTNNIVHGDIIKNISGGIIYLTAGVTSANEAIQTSIHFSGKASQTIDGQSINNISAGAFLFVPSKSPTSKTSGVYLGPSSGSIKSGLVNIITGGIFDQKQLGSTINFGGQAVSWSTTKLTNVIGVQNSDGRNEGPIFISSGATSLGAGWGQYGVTEYSKTAVTDAAAITSDNIVIDTTIYGGQFSSSSSTVLSPTSNVDSSKKYYPRTQGSISIKIYGGEFENDVYIKNGGDLYGHLTCDIYGGNFKNIYGTGITTSMTTDGIEINIHNLNGYGKPAETIYNFDLVNTGSVNALTPGRPAMKCTIEGGTGRMNLLLDNSNNVIKGTADVSVTGGWFGTVSGDLANGMVSGGSYSAAPAAALIAPGLSAVNYPMTIDKFWTCHIGTAGDHVHCECVGNAVGVGSHVCDDTTVWNPLVTSEDVLATYSASAPKEGYYYLTRDIVLSGMFKIPTGYKIHLCLNGHTLQGPAGSRAVQMYVSSGTYTGEFSITDCSPEETGKIVGSYHEVNGATILAYSGAKLNLYAGTITGGQGSALNAAKGSGGNVNLGANGTFNMYGGKILDGVSHGNGGNLVVSGIFNMYGGVISGGRCINPETTLEKWTVGGNIYFSYSKGELNLYGGVIENGKAPYGGNIYASSGKMTLMGTTIRNGEATVRNGGNLLGDKGCDITILSGTIENGVVRGVDATTKTANFNGGNMYIQGTLKIQGGEIKNGVATNGGNIYVNADTPDNEFSMSAGTLSGGTACIGGNVTTMKDFTISGTAMIKEGKAIKAPTGGDGHGGNLYVGTNGIIHLTGGTVKDGIAENGGANLSITSGTAGLEMTGGLIAGGTKDGETNVSSIRIFNKDTIAVTITGGTILTNAPEQISILNDKTKAMEISGGYIGGTVSGSVGGYVSGGYYETAPDEKYLESGLAPFKLATPATSEGGTFYYEIGEGGMVLLTSRAAQGDMSVAALQGGGAYRKNASYTITAPDLSAEGYTFVGWEKDGETVTADYSYTATMTDDVEYTAVYKFGKTTLRLTVNGTKFTVKIGDGAEESFETTVTKNVTPGTAVTVNFTNADKDFGAWTNVSDKRLTTEKEFTFDMMADETLTAKEESAEEGQTTILYMSAKQQILKTAYAKGGFTAYDVTVPAAIGKTNGRWDKTVSEIDELVKGGESVIMLKALYDSLEETGIITVQKATVTALANGKFTGFAAVDGESDDYTVDTATAATIPAEDLVGYVFLCFANADKNVVTYDATLTARANAAAATVYYAVYGTAEAEDVPTVTINFAELIGANTIQLDALRHIPEDYALIDQGLLIGLTAKGCTTENAKAVLSYGNANAVQYKSTGILKDDITTLRIKNLNDTNTFACGYVVYRDAEGNQGVIYSDIAVFNATSVSFIAH